MFKVLKTSKISKARVGEIITAHGVVKTPCFMPVGTRGLVKGLASADLEQLGADIMLANTYHLKLEAENLLQEKRLRELNGWTKPILTDSGGFQVFSLAQWRKITDEGVEFRHPLSGLKIFLTPESCLDFQLNKIGSDMAMVLDVCPPSEAGLNELREACALTTAWAERALLVKKDSGQLVFAICQGGTDEALRRQHAQIIGQMSFDGFAIGGVAVGESPDKIKQALSWALEYLPKDKPRYAMGVGDLAQMYEAINLGVDMFDCVVPTREARHGRIYLWQNGKQGIFGDLNLELQVIDIKKSSFQNNFDLICSAHPLPEVAGCSYGWLSYLFKINEVVGAKIATSINLWTYLTFFEKVREKILKETN